MIKHLRIMDRLYFGERVGRGSALSMFVCFITGFTPMHFARRYFRGDFDEAIADLGLI